MNETLTFTNSHDIYESYNLKEKVYPNGLVKLKKYSFDTIKGRISKNSHNGNSTKKELEKYLKKRVKERREKIIDLAFSNSWDYFVTLTFNPNDVNYFPNGYSHEVAIKLLSEWLHKQRRKNKYMRYIVVSEFHKESGNLHFHGLFTHVNWSLSPAWNSKKNIPLVINGVEIFNLNDYDLGFTTISKIQDSRKVSIYLSKYITKDLISLYNKKVFWHSRNLEIPKIFYKYVDKSLNEIYSQTDLSFYKQIKKSDSLIEIAEVQKT